MSLNCWNPCKNSLTHIRRLFPKRQVYPKTETPLYTSYQGSFVVEAAVGIPVFLFFLIVILFFFNVETIQIQIETALHITGEKVAQYACLEKHDSSTKSTMVEYAGSKGILYQQLEDQKVRTDRIIGGASGILLSESDFTGDYIELKAAYHVKMPITFFGIASLPMHQTVKVRKWIGDIAADTNEEYVYVTEYGTVYHRSQECRYLDLHIHTTHREAVAKLRNKDGRIYQACSCTSRSESGILYITDYGVKYHGDINCRALKRTIYRIRLSDVGTRGACSKCCGGNNND